MKLTNLTARMATPSMHTLENFSALMVGVLGDIGEWRVLGLGQRLISASGTNQQQPFTGSG